VSSLVLLIAGAELAQANGRWLTLLDAMRGESFTQLIDVTAAGAISEASELRVVREEEIATLARTMHARTAGPGRELDASPHARGVARLAAHPSLRSPVDVELWEPDYGRLAEAQVRWETAHGRSLNMRSL
jgi:tRNA threonylcarbamoyladenosine biosynthesis protein TsaB